jgi:hypothetical protein
VFDTNNCRSSRTLDIVAKPAFDLAIPGAAAATPPTPTQAPAGRTTGAASPFDSRAAVKALDSAAGMAGTVCRAEAGKARRAVVSAGFEPDGTNSSAKVTNATEIGPPAAACVEAIFRRVKVPAFDQASRPSGLSRVVLLK